MIAQNLSTVILESTTPIETPIAVKVNANGKLEPCDDAATFIGVATPGIEPDIQTLRAKPTTGPLVVYHKGIAEVIVTAGTYEKGITLTVDSTNPGQLKPAGAGDTVIALAAQTETLSNDDILQVIIL